MTFYLPKGITTDVAVHAPTRAALSVKNDVWKLWDVTAGNTLVYASSTAGVPGIPDGGWAIYLSADRSTFHIFTPSELTQNEHDLILCFYRPNLAVAGGVSNYELPCRVGNPASVPDAIEYLAAHTPQQPYNLWLTSSLLTDNSPGDTTTGYTDTWDGSVGAGGNISPYVSARYHFDMAQEMHGIDFSFLITEGNAQYQVRASLDAVDYDTLIPPTNLIGLTEHRIRQNFVFPAKTYNFYNVTVYTDAKNAASAVTLSDCRLYPFFTPRASLIGGTVSSPGSAVNLAYSTEFALSASIDNGVGNIPLNVIGNIAVYPTVTTTYTLTVINAYGIVSSALTVVVEPLLPPTATLTTSTPIINAGQPVILSCTTTYVDTAELTPGIGTVTVNTTEGITVYPAVTTLYTLVGQGLGGEAVATCLVTVNRPPVIGCMDRAALNYNPSATQDSNPTACLYLGGLPGNVNTSQVRRPIAVTVSAEIILSTVQTDFSSPPTVTVSLSNDQKTALGLVSGATVTSLQGLAFYTGAKLQIPTVDVTQYDAAACAARVGLRLDDTGTLTFYLLPGPYSSADISVPELYTHQPGQVPYLVPGTWHVWALLVLSSYRW